MRLHYLPAAPADRDAARRMREDAGYADAYAGPQTLQSMRAATDTISRHELVRQVDPQVAIRSGELAGVPCEFLEAAGARRDAVLLFLHGGAFVRGNLGLGRANAALLARATGLRVAALGYRQAPEHPYPAAPDDVHHAFVALQQGGLAANRIAVVGESSGGCLALGLVAALAASGMALPAGVAALSPMTDLDMRGASWAYNAGNDVATIELGRKALAMYIPATRRNDPVASPIRFDFARSCPLFIGIGSHETMLSDAELLARKADDAGVDVTLAVYEGMPHGFTRLHCPIASQAVRDAAGWCMERLPPA